MLNVEEIEKAVVIGDKESSISFEYSLANVLDKCEVDELETTNIKYDCYFVITIAVAGIEQSDINYKFSVIIDRNT